MIGETILARTSARCKQAYNWRDNISLIIGLQSASWWSVNIYCANFWSTIGTPIIVPPILARLSAVFFNSANPTCDSIFDLFSVCVYGYLLLALFWTETNDSIYNRKDIAAATLYILLVESVSIVAYVACGWLTNFPTFSVASLYCLFNFVVRRKASSFAEKLRRRSLEWKKKRRFMLGNVSSRRIETRREIVRCIYVHIILTHTYVYSILYIYHVFHPNHSTFFW